MGKMYSIAPADESKQLKLGWTVTETIGVGIVNPRGLDPFLRIKHSIEDFCHYHHSPKEIHDFIGGVLVKHREFAPRIKNTVLKICPQYEEMIDKIIILL